MMQTLLRRAVTHPVVSYDMMRRHNSKLKACLDIQLLVCDEAHRLKNIDGNATIDALNGLAARRRVLLSGTPIQNDLDEFYAMVSGTPTQNSPR